MTQELSPDQKGQASLTLKDVIVRTRNNFPDPRFRPNPIYETRQYFIGGINPYPYEVRLDADGIGTKPELAERLTDALEDPKHFETLAFDTFAMVESDQARWGIFTLGIANIIDCNTAHPDIIDALARGAGKACTTGQFPLLNGETAELGYRTSGWGPVRVNWNAVALGLINRNKLITGEKLKPGLPLVAVRELSLRSNGYSKARKILESNFLIRYGCSSKEEYFQEIYKDHLKEHGLSTKNANNVSKLSLDLFKDNVFGHDFFEQLLIPWHELETEVTREMLKPSTLHSRLMYAAQGGVDGPKEINMVAAAHISGGGVPEKVKRMIENKGLGAHIDTVFPDPDAVTSLIKLAGDLTDSEGNPLIDDRSACTQWNRGIGFIFVTETQNDAKRLVDLAEDEGYEAAIAGEILPEPKIEWRGHKWTYKPATA
jgi:phosphoribosylformylglycinamidine cyclo-ligase